MRLVIWLPPRVRRCAAALRLVLSFFPRWS